MVFRWVCVGGLGVTLAAGCAVETPGDPRRAQVEQGLRAPVVFDGDAGWTIEERMRHHGVPGVSLAVIADGAVAWFAEYGVADRETGAPVTPDTLFQAGSVSKPVAAFGALTLVRDGRLTLDGDVNATLTSWQLPPHDFPGKPVTLTHLLSHTGGLTVHGFPGYAVDAPVPTVVQVLDGAPPANTPAVRVDLEPGSQWRYSGGGYTIAQLLMADAAGQPFEALMAERVLGPLGMRHSTFENPLPSSRLKDAAAGYRPDHSPVPGKRHTYPEMAAAGLWTTARDLATFAVEVQRAWRGESRVLDRAHAQALLEPLVPAFGRGFALSQRDGHAYFGHNGWDEGFCALLLASRDGGHGVAVMINSNHPAFMDEVARGVAHAYGWPGYPTRTPRPIPEVALESLPGRYRYNAEQAFRIYREDERLYLQYVGGDPEELLLTDDDRYLRRTRETPIVFTTDDAGAVTFHFVLDDAGSRQSHERLADDERTPRELLADGRYDEARDAYRALRAAESDVAREGYLNNQGLDLVQRDRFELGLALLRINTELYPESANTWDSVGWAYRHHGDTANAIRYYEKALEIDPQFRSAVEALAELR